MKSAPPKSELCTRIIRWSEEDACYIGSLPEICGNCCHGATAAEVGEQLDVIAAEWLAIEASGKVILPPPRKA